MKRWCLLLVVATLALPTAAFAQGTDVYLFDLADGYRLVAQVTDREGYDNQPSFTLDSEALLFSSDRAGGQVDIFRYEISSGEIANLTDTPDANEYSGRAYGPGHYSFVLQEGSPYQNVWYRRWDGGEIHRVLTSFIPVGYYVVNRSGVLFWGRYAYALFFEPAGAEVGPARGEGLFVIGDAGTSIHAIPGGDRFSFVHKQGDWSWVIKSFDPASRAIAPLVPIPGRSENYCWAPDGAILIADGTRILAFQPGVDAGWQPLVELRAPGLNQLGRCAVSPDGRYLAVVNDRSS